jgi:basic membrane protein A and related proteins
MKKFRFAIGFAASAAMIGSTVALAGPVAAQATDSVRPAKALTVGLVTDKGGLNDKSFNHLADLGLVTAEHQLGIKGAVLQSHTGADYVPNLTEFAREKKGLTIAVGFLMEGALYQVANEFPHQKFAIVDGQPACTVGSAGPPMFCPTKTPSGPVASCSAPFQGTESCEMKNVANLFFKPEQSGYLVGLISGLLEKEHRAPNWKKNTVGSIAGGNFLAVTAYNCGYQEGVWSVDPKAKVLIDFDDGTFQNTPNANAIGLKQVSEGAGILFQVDGGAGLGYLQAAQSSGVWGIGVDADQDYLGKPASKHSPDKWYVITSALKKVNEAVFLTIKRVKSRTFHAEDNLFSLRNGATGFATDTHHVPGTIKSKALAAAKKIAKGKIKVNPVCVLGKK